jgi:Flp pilus assembly protein TadD
VEEEAIKAREEKDERERIKQERKELRKKIRQREEAKKIRAAYLLEMSEKANVFYEQKWLVVHFGWAPWRKYVANARINMFLAYKHCQVINI